MERLEGKGVESSDVFFQLVGGCDSMAWEVVCTLPRAHYVIRLTVQSSCEEKLEG